MKSRLRGLAARAIANAGHAAYLGIRTAGQTAAGLLTGAGTGLLDTDWIGIVSVAGMSGLVAVLMNLTSAPAEVDPAPNQD